MGQSDAGGPLEQQQPAYGGSNRLLFVKVILGVAAGFAVVVVGLSPRIYLGSRDTPEALAERARQLLEDQQYDKAIAVYQQILRMEKPRERAFVEAERAIPRIRELKGLGQQDGVGEGESEENGAEGPEAREPARGAGGGEAPEVDDLTF